MIESNASGCNITASIIFIRLCTERETLPGGHFRNYIPRSGQ